jgi:hypothetical protein
MRRIIPLVTSNKAPFLLIGEAREQEEPPEFDKIAWSNFERSQSKRP